jgi:uncharacterized membrane protein YhaH (DUF805 family)
MTDVSNTTPINPEELLNKVKDSIPKEVTWTVKELANATKQITNVTSKATDLMGDQLSHLSEAVGSQEILSEMNQELTPMKDFIIHILKVAFFVQKEERITRGEYIIGSLAVTVIIGLFTGLISALLWKLWVLVWFLLMTVPLFNLAIKRFHDLNKPGRRSAMILIPFFGIIMPALFKGTEWVNPYGPDPIPQTPKDNKDYIITILALFILSSLITTILWFVGIQTKKPEVDPTDPTMMGDKNVVGSQTNNIKDKTVNTTKQKAASTTTNAKKVTQ